MSNALDGSLLTWGLVLLIGTPLLTIALGELADRSAGAGSRYTRSINLVRSVIVPAFAAFIIVRNVLEIDEATTLRRTIASVVLIACAWVGFIIVGAIHAEADPERWENRLPGLVKTLVRVAILVYPLFLLTEVWGLALSSAATALGVGSLVLAFALQDTLGSIVSGFLLILDKPFAVGDWVAVDGYIGQVRDINWRSTRLVVNGHDVVVIPNVNLASTSILNYTATDIAFRDELVFGFSGDHPPNLVRETLEDVAADCPYIAADPAPEIHLASFDDFSNGFKIIYYLTAFEGDMHQDRVREDLRTRVFYAANRVGLEMPLPTEVRRVITEVDERTEEKLLSDVLSYLELHRYFSMVPPDLLHDVARTATTVDFGRGETILHRGSISEAFYLVRSGQVRVVDPQLDPNEMVTLRSGEVFGEMALMGNGRTTADCVAATDVTLLRIPPGPIRSVVEQEPLFARKLTELIESRMLHDRADGQLLDVREPASVRQERGE